MQTAPSNKPDSSVWRVARREREGRNSLRTTILADAITTMVDQTPRFDLDDFEPGDTNWDHSDLVQFVDEHSIERGPIADRPAEGDYDDEFYFAEDQNILWRWDDTAGDWTGVSGRGSESQPLPGTVYRESVHTERTSRNVGAATVDNLVYKDDGEFVAVERPTSSVISTHSDPGDAVNAALDNLPHSVGSTTTAGKVGCVFGEETTTTQVDLGERQYLVGLGHATTRLQADSTNPPTQLLNVNGENNWGIGGMAFDASSAAQYAARLHQTNSWSIEDAMFTQAAGRCIYSTESVYDFHCRNVVFSHAANECFRAENDFNEGQFDRCSFVQGDVGFWTRNQDTGISQPRGIQFNNCAFASNATSGCDLFGAVGIDFVNPYVENNKYGIRMVQDGESRTVRNTHVNGGWFLGNSSRHVQFINTDDCSIEGAYLDARDQSMVNAIDIKSSAVKTFYRGNTIVASGSGGYTTEINDAGTRSKPNGTIFMSGAPSAGDYADEDAGTRIIDISGSPWDEYLVDATGSLVGPK